MRFASFALFILHLNETVMKRLENKVIVITGAGMGLGLATAVKAARQGAQLALVDYNEEALEAARAIHPQGIPANAGGHHQGRCVERSRSATLR